MSLLSRPGVVPFSECKNTKYFEHKRKIQRFRHASGSKTPPRHPIGKTNRNRPVPIRAGGAWGAAAGWVGSVGWSDPGPGAARAEQVRGGKRAAAGAGARAEGGAAACVGAGGMLHLYNTRPKIPYRIYPRNT